MQQWRPDRKTIDWTSSVLVEDYLYEYVRSDVRSRCASSDAQFEFPELPDVFWLTVTEAAIETVVFELHTKMQAAYAQPADEPTDGEPLD